MMKATKIYCAPDCNTYLCTVGEKLLGFEAIYDWRFLIPLCTEISYPLLHDSDSITWNCSEKKKKSSKFQEVSDEVQSIFGILIQASIFI
jgi:hypothetical protein